MIGIVALWIGSGLVGLVIGSGKHMGPVAGFALGLLLGPLGWLIAGLSAKPGALEKIQARPAEAGWHDDPLGRFDGRYFDGQQWTQHVGRIEGDGTRRQLEDPL